MWTKARLVEAVEKGESFDYLFFWGHTPKRDGVVDASCFSQWFPRAFEHEGVRYATAEHFMMAGKADRRTRLESSGGKVLVEASPRDTIWGIGSGASNPDARVPGRWRGTNLLGFALMEVRAQLARPSKAG
ncbi:MAG TPA: NADAR family protein [Polyangiaceae bacterium]|jgi:hypothetical protein